MKKYSIVKIGFRTYEVWIDNNRAIHFYGKKNAFQALRLIEELENGW